MTVFRIDVDTEKSKRQAVIKNLKEYFGEDNVLNTLTLRTVGSKSAAQICCKGLGINNDIAQTIADLIPFERGSNWSLSDCFYGNIEKKRKPVTELINMVAQYPNLKEMLFMVEGLVCGRGIHASAMYIFDNGYLEYNARMKAPNGEWITAYNMHDSDYLGALKFDCLTVAALDKIHTAVDMLCDYHLITPEQTLKATYDKHIHPDTLDYDSPEMWDMLCQNKLIDAFQFDTTQGLQVTRITQPHSIFELATSNSLMRLMAPEGEEQPADTYAHNKEDITKWYQEMENFGLTQDEIEVMKEHLLPLYGVAESQEAVMKLSMDKRISGFSVAEANKVRKAVAKKSPKVLQQVQDLFFEKGKTLGTSKTMLNYVWNVQFKKSFGYSFSQNHCLPYSCICLQEMNIAHRYPKLFWNAACLSVNAGATDTETEDGKSTQYGKIAKAMGAIQKQGQALALPHINAAKAGFAPSVETDEIMFSLKGISGIGDAVVNTIIANRPYASLADFCEKMKAYKEAEEGNKFSDGNIITLIKAGCFDKLEGKPREDIMYDFIRSITSTKSELTMRNVPALIKYNVLTDDMSKTILRIHNFRQYVTDKKFLVRAEGKSESTKVFLIEPIRALPFFYEFFESEMKEGKDYFSEENGDTTVKKGALDRVYKKLTNDFKNTVLVRPTVVEAYNEVLVATEYQKRVSGTVSQWEMESLCFYYHDHELANVDTEKYSIVDYDSLSENPVVIEVRKYGEKSFPRFQLSRICGTVLDKNKNKHIVSLLTPTGVVNVKFYKGQYVFYDKQLSEIGTDGKKTVLEKSWFSRGNKLLITGIRRGDQFVPRKYADSAFKHTVQLITNVSQDGNLRLQSERYGYESDDR